MNQNDSVEKEPVVQTKTVRQAADFESWWNINHPWDWWAKDRVGEPLPYMDRLRVWELCRRAWIDASNLNTSDADTATT